MEFTKIGKSKEGREAEKARKTDSILKSECFLQLVFTRLSTSYYYITKKYFYFVLKFQLVHTFITYKNTYT